MGRYWKVGDDMKFQYDGEPTLHETVLQAVGYGSICWTDVAGAGTFEAGKAARAGEDAVQHIRDAVTLRLAKLLDGKGEAQQWNEAIEEALRTVEAMR